GEQSRKGLTMSDRIRVLLVDDDPDFIEANSIVLEAVGFQVLTAASGAAGLLMVEREKPDVVVLDVMMENTDEGFDVARRIRQRLHSSVPIIMLTSVGKVTGYDYKPEEHPDFFPVEAFLEKPVPPATLISRIREVLEKGEK
ncbi:MAG: response regulator, partial [Candidatus Fermentibacteraceae bacterium]